MAASAGSSSAGGSAAVRMPRSPPLKVLAEQLRRDVEGVPGAWRLGGGEARLRDPSGAFSVRGLERVPRGRPCLAPGTYVMVMGVVQACSPEPCLQAVKMTDLSDNPIHESMWELEVEDLHRNIP
ncbi:PREDICTED: recQ-mediated genome instability protein 2 [Galeopterus variegatus]|uniref:RecQ-mediated genome instability protein 2 n=1 Tax=Galeopterus variegatus TaxID=482537 RepID=A0ABM0SGN4_GALVR|nr:PREDICTED: recQ-mediated genome instability protein 2 [Galeopterus variegatus]